MCAPGMPFEIEHATIDGHDTRCWKKAAPSMAAIVQSSLEYAEADFIVYMGERLSYAEHYRRVVAVAHQLIERFDIKKGDRVAIAMRNYPEWSMAEENAGNPFRFTGKAFRRGAMRRCAHRLNRP
jgi:long-chain acyl-CoA synthetase